jgi:hypothetical protein
MADKKDEGKEKQEKETKKPEEKEQELVCQNLLKIAFCVFKILESSHCIHVELNSTTSQFCSVMPQEKRC